MGFVSSRVHTAQSCLDKHDELMIMMITTQFQTHDFRLHLFIPQEVSGNPLKKRKYISKLAKEEGSVANDPCNSHPRVYTYAFLYGVLCFWYSFNDSYCAATVNFQENCTRFFLMAYFVIYWPITHWFFWGVFS